MGTHSELAPKGHRSSFALENFKSRDLPVDKLPVESIWPPLIHRKSYNLMDADIAKWVTWVTETEEHHKY